ncbi:MAG: protein RarD [Candidatus Dactylopiibacterium carminicum]|uniref:EamA family transporter RarD n=1 Tax=Candidatus Dactylopiibacterium carminicum TaxID=857335 RepID=A0A272ES18_9RHOO|nr:EamA family transporter RarD [Candidatus Dactylopiibacterium carminicum]KAF7598683.1 EamA family transporter RarD [Candidatus Dactylopiibacterium carminicum]PAS92500.1 MAG: protein RarD [Candidatus Dactylopiibacterium carminicum]PAS96296.1 MAG: protein RarD [Candidatus Dactylopiibacterium carminicum]PAS98551.1 MAG: EamA family transporter [Candidatus Dactylopiibacterium carminicum]
MQTGILYALAAHLCWSLFSIYFKALESVPPLEVLLHRMVWSLVFLAGVLTVQRNWGWLLPALRRRKLVAGFAASAVLLALNWFIYIWAVKAGRVVDASLGYFINPLVNVLFGVLFLRERLRVAQWFAIVLAASGVAWFAFRMGELPWISLALAFTFGGYGLLRKTASLGALEGLTLETLLLFPFSAGALLWFIGHGQSSFVVATPGIQALLLAAGPLTSIPLLMFAAGARRLPLSLLGLLQYINPTIQLLLGVWLWHEPFDNARLIGFALIWAALLFYTLESLFVSKLRRS